MKFLPEPGTLDPRLVPDRGLAREGVIKHTFIELWSVASVEWPGTAYLKSEWKVIDAGLFTDFRSVETKHGLIESFERQWALAVELPGYDVERWRFLARLIQDS